MKTLALVIGALAIVGSVACAGSSPSSGRGSDVETTARAAFMAYVNRDEGALRAIAAPQDQNDASNWIRDYRGNYFDDFSGCDLNKVKMLTQDDPQTGRKIVRAVLPNACGRRSISYCRLKMINLSGKWYLTNESNPIIDCRQ